MGVCSSIFGSRGLVGAAVSFVHANENFQSKVSMNKSRSLPFTRADPSIPNSLRLHPTWFCSAPPNTVLHVHADPAFISIDRQLTTDILSRPVRFHSSLSLRHVCCKLEFLGAVEAHHLLSVEVSINIRCSSETCITDSSGSGQPTLSEALQPGLHASVTPLEPVSDDPHAAAGEIDFLCCSVRVDGEGHSHLTRVFLRVRVCCPCVGADVSRFSFESPVVPLI